MVGPPLVFVVGSPLAFGLLVTIVGEGEIREEIDSEFRLGDAFFPGRGGLEGGYFDASAG